MRRKSKPVHVVTGQEEHEFCKIKGIFDLDDTYKVFQQFDDHGNHRLVYQDLASEWASYQGIANLNIPEVGQFRGTSDYYKGCLSNIFQYIDSFTSAVKGE